MMTFALSWMVLYLSSNSIEIKRNTEIRRSENEEMLWVVDTSKMACVGLIH